MRRWGLPSSGTVHLLLCSVATKGCPQTIKEDLMVKLRFIDGFVRRCIPLTDFLGPFPSPSPLPTSWDNNQVANSSRRATVALMHSYTSKFCN